MPQQTAAARRSQHARPARRVSPHHPRRVSGALRPATAPAGAAAPTRGRTSTFERIGRLPDHRLVDGLLRSRAWIVIVGVLLGGIVAMQVSLLKLNAGISRAIEASATLERQNADMQDAIARLSSGQRVSDMATGRGMVFPAAGDVRYLRARGARDAQLAARRLTPPSAHAKAVMASGGQPASPVTATATDPTTAASTTVAPTTAVPAATTDPTAATTTTTTTEPATTTSATTTPATTTPATTTPATTTSATTAPATTAPATTTPATTTPATVTPPAADQG